MNCMLYIGMNFEEEKKLVMLFERISTDLQKEFLMPNHRAEEKGGLNCDGKISGQ